MHVFEEYISNIGNPELKQRTQDILQWVEDTFPSIRAKNCLESAYVHRSRHIYYWV